ncbi:MAG: lysine--tRNA ligase, partial [Alphaproteobacteria bacterium]|nr:lysine--tRNA ligase [Alphaproteobacteria bacterium]
MNLVHWADQTAVRVIKEKGDKEIYTLASGVSPSGFAHFGHLREVITTDFVARALIKMGKKVRFIYSWDDFDTFRKVPGNLPNPEMLTENLFKSVSQVPDPFGKEACLADAFEKPFEKEIAKVGIDYVEFIRQGKMYPQNKYNKGMQIALKNKDKIKKILDEWRKEPLPKDYLPINFYCEKCGKDRTNNTGYDGRSVSYHCESCGFDGSEDIETTKRAKLPWKVDWPMRWAYEKVDFEPGGKDHSTQGSSYTVGKKIVELFDWTAP